MNDQSFPYTWFCDLVDEDGQETIWTNDTTWDVVVTSQGGNPNEEKKYFYTCSSEKATHRLIYGLLADYEKVQNFKKALG